VFLFFFFVFFFFSSWTPQSEAIISGVCRKRGVESLHSASRRSRAMMWRRGGLVQPGLAIEDSYFFLWHEWRSGDGVSS